MQQRVPNQATADHTLARRQFLEKSLGRSLAVLGVAAAGALVYERPSVKSFSPEVTAYAQTTGAGTFTLKGTT